MMPIKIDAQYLRSDQQRLDGKRKLRQQQQ
jgi:hypothetical protein